MGRNLVGTAAAVGATAATGSVASAANRSRWYKKLHKPPYQPPAQAFPVVWTTLYADIAATSASPLAALEGRPREPRAHWVAPLSIWRRYTR